MTYEGKIPIQKTVDLRQLASAVAAELLAHAGEGGVPIIGTGGGSFHRRLPEDLRSRFIGVRAALFRRGIFDPVLVRFDSGTVSQASTRDIAEQLAKWGGKSGAADQESGLVDR